MKKLVAVASSMLMFATLAFAIHNGLQSTQTSGGSTNDCNINPGCTTTSSPKVKLTSRENSPKGAPSSRPMQITNSDGGNDPLHPFLKWQP